MTTRYKLTAQDCTTHNGYALPGVGEWFYPEDRTSDPAPCSNTVLHHYADPLLAVIFNPIHAAYAAPRLFEIEIDAEIGSDGLKGWCRAQRIVRELPLPVITIEQCVAFAIYCAEPYYTASAWREWARKWMSGEDRTVAAARAAADAAHAAAYAAAYAAYAYARAAADAARAAAARAARADAARAARAARAADTASDFLVIINRVMKGVN